MQRKKRAVAIQDVAKTAGVSVSSISRVLNGKVDVTCDTQGSISNVINTLGYTANLAARSVRSQKKNLVGLTVLLPIEHIALTILGQHISEKCFVATQMLMKFVNSKPAEKCNPASLFDFSQTLTVRV